MQLRCRGVAVDIENENLAGIQATGPQIASVVREAGMMGFVAAANRDAVHHLTVFGGDGIDVDRDELILLIAYTWHTKCPDVDDIFLANNFCHVRRHTGFVGVTGH